MKQIELKNKNLNYKDFIKRSAKETDYDQLITESCIGIENGEIKFVYQELPDWNTSEVVKALKTIKYIEGKRARGLVSRSRIFGFKPRLEMRGDYCSSTSLAFEFPKEHAIICGLASKIEDLYKSTHPDGYEFHKKVTDEKIKPAWRINNSVFTSGIVNKNNPLKYHFDTGNFTKVYSCMPVFKSGIKGGHLALPEYGLGIELKNNSIFMFDGQSILHGVTPIEYESPLSYRYSVVYYSLKRVWQCLEINEELARIRQKKTDRERSRVYRSVEETRALIERKGKQ